jgi:broad specificity phosphatase PhoE
VYDEAFRERHGGIFQGYTPAELKLAHPQALQAFLDHGHSPPGAESNLDLARRATPALDRIIAAHPGETIALVTHGGTLRVLIAYIMGLPVGRRPPIKVSHNTGLTIAEMAPGQNYITLLNDCCHVEELEPTTGREKSAEDPSADQGYVIG